MMIVITHVHGGRHYRSRLRTIVDVIPELIAVLAPDGQALYVNRSGRSNTPVCLRSRREGSSSVGASFTPRTLSGSNLQSVGPVSDQRPLDCGGTRPPNCGADVTAHYSPPAASCARLDGAP